MTCYHPLQGWRPAPEYSVNGRLIFTTDENKIRSLKERGALIQVRCGKCIGCRSDYSLAWAIRGQHESLMSEYPKGRGNCFITLTYSPQNCPEGLQLEEFQKFMKRLRERYVPVCPYSKHEKEERSLWFKQKGIKYFHCAEYGSEYGRPHYHACLFNFDFEDKVLYKERNGFNLYKSAELAKLWPYGYVTVGSVSFSSMSYCARYVLKKALSDQEKRYSVLESPDGELVELPSEYTTMSNGIGKSWLEKFSTDVYTFDHVVINGKEYRPPPAYDKWYSVEHEDEMLAIKSKRVESIKNREWDELDAMEKKHKARISLFMPRRSVE